MAGKRLLEGLCAVITGSTSGIGLGVARRMAASGANILMNGIEEQQVVEKLVKSVAEEGQVKTLFHPANMANRDEIRDMIATAEREFGRLDILVNNAAIQHTESLDKFPEEIWDRMLQINLSAPFIAVKAAFPGMRDRKFGRIINMGSVHSLVASLNKGMISHILSFISK